MSKMTTKEETVTKRVSSYTPRINTRATVISRSSVGSMSGQHMGGGQSFRSSMSMSGAGFHIPSSKYVEASAEGVNNFKESREREKHDLQDLNERLADYIEKVRFSEAQNKALLAELERIKKTKGVDFNKIKAMYTDELKNARDIIDQLSKEKAEFDVKLVSIEDQLSVERNEHDNEVRMKEEYKDKLDRVNDQLGEREGEIATLRHRVASQEDEISKLRDTIRRLQDDNNRLRADLDAETLSHINEANRAQSLEEELTFITQVYEEQIKELEMLANRDTTIEMRDYWKGEMSKALREIQTEYDSRLDMIRNDLDMKYSMQLQHLRVGATKENMEVQYSKDELKRIKDKLNDVNAKMADLTSKNAMLEARNRDLEMTMSERESEYEGEKQRSMAEIAKLKRELEAVLVELQVLMDAKLSLELEICAYRKLLEHEENRITLRSTMESVGGFKSSSGSHMEQVVQSSGIQTSETTGRLTVHRTARGPISFSEISPDGRYIVIANTGSGYRAKSQNMKGWTIKRTVAGKDNFEYKFEDYELEPEKEVKIWCSGASKDRGSKDLVAKDMFTWGVGICSTVLTDNNSAEKATHNQKFVS